MSYTDKELYETAITFAESRMQIMPTARRLFFDKRSITRRLRECERRFGLNPFNFYELTKLVHISKQKLNKRNNVAIGVVTRQTIKELYEIAYNYAENGMRTATTARLFYMSNSNVSYKFDLIQKITGLDPRNFWQLHEFLTRYEKGEFHDGNK